MTTERTSIRTRAHAKINLDLRILGRRPDGYHEIETLMHTIGLHDELEIRRTDTPGLELECVGVPGTPGGPDNLVYRAAETLLRLADTSSGVRIRLTKRIPMGAGLGGGSSDCAATIVSLHFLLRLRLPFDELEQIAARFGSDVPFFLHSGLAVALGRGEQILRMTGRRRARVVLATPRVHVATADAYRWFAETRKRTARPATRRRSDQYLKAMTASYRRGDWSGLSNDLEGVVFERYPALAQIKACMQQHGAAMAQMTGSGSAVFGIFEEENSIRAARKALSRIGIPSLRTHLLPRGCGNVPESADSAD